VSARILSATAGPASAWQGYLPTDGSSVGIDAASGGHLVVLVLGPDEALRAWTPTVSARRLLVLSDVDIIVGQDTLVALAEATGAVRVLFSAHQRLADRA
jgi:hypothetical protein